MNNIDPKNCVLVAMSHKDYFSVQKQIKRLKNQRQSVRLKLEERRKLREHVSPRSKNYNVSDIYTHVIYCTLNGQKYDNIPENLIK